jgi:hypothetical protein
MNISKESVFLTVILVLFTLVNTAYANDVQILVAEFQDSGAQTWSVNITLKHNDAGWKHYADNWRIVDNKGNILGNRVLMHPHVNEQPFTRGLGNVMIPENVKTVYVEAHDKVHGWTAKKLQVDLEKATDGLLTVTATK